MTYRTATLEPWYHVSPPQCITTTLAKRQCIFSARYTDVKTETIFLCKTHADMADFPVKLIRPQRRVIRED